MRACPRCKTEKTLDAFTTKQKWCRACRREYDRSWLINNRLKKQQRNERWRKKVYEWFVELKSGPCVDCGGKFHPQAMQFDHTADDKLSDISSMVASAKSKERILAEIAKCELVCANCHAVRTYNRRAGIAQG